MSYDEKIDRINWKDETSWLVISFASGLLLAFVYICFDRFPEANNIAIYTVCCVGFYLLSILVRIQNHRGKPLTGKLELKKNT